MAVSRSQRRAERRCGAAAALELVRDESVGAGRAVAARVSGDRLGA